MKNNINNLLEKYWEAETSLQEEAILKSYFAGINIDDSHKQYLPLFSHFGTKKTEASQVNMTQLFGQLEGMDELLEKYFGAETTLAEEKLIKAYFKGGEVAERHAQYIPLFSQYEQSKQVGIDLDLESLFSEQTSIDHLLEKYWNAETSIEEETQLRHYFASESVADNHEAYRGLFDFYSLQKESTSNLSIEEVITTAAENQGEGRTDNATPNKEAKVFNLRKLATAVAAIFVIAFAAISVMDQTQSSEQKYKGKFVQLDEEADAQEAYEITKEALAFLSKNMNKGSETVTKSVAKAEKARIFK